MNVPGSCVLYVCVTCKKAGGQDPVDPQALRPGAKMLEALQTQSLPAGIELKPVECLSACSRGCSVALAAPGKWTFVYGDMNPDRDVDDILAGAKLYAQSADGLTPWRERPEIFRKQSLARVPPF